MRLQRARDAGITVLFVLDPFGSVRPTTPTHEEEPEAVTRVAQRVDGQEVAWRDAAYVLALERLGDPRGPRTLALITGVRAS